MARKLAWMTLAVILVPVALWAQTERKDFQIFKDVAGQIEQYVRYSVFDDVSIGIDKGVVTLTGKVTMPYKVGDIERRVAKVEGVRQVRNDLQVLPVSFFDDELRYRIARAIYNNPAFWQYASMSNPPIHIVVENGHVTLTGVVQNNVERMLARSLALSFNAFSVDNKLRTDAEAKAELEKIFVRLTILWAGHVSGRRTGARVPPRAALGRRRRAPGCWLRPEHGHCNLTKQCQRRAGSRTPSPVGIAATVTVTVPLDDGLHNRQAQPAARSVVRREASTL
jgi:hyperosmotically inducible protein